MTKLVFTAGNNNFKIHSKVNDYVNFNLETRSWCSNGTPKSVTKIDRNLTEYFYHYMRNIDFPMRVSYCWNFSEAHRDFFNQTYLNKFCCNVCGNRAVSEVLILSETYSKCALLFFIISIFKIYYF